MDMEANEINDIEQEILNALEDLTEATAEAPPEADNQGDMDGPQADPNITDMGKNFEFSGHIDPKLIKAWMQGLGSIVDECKLRISRQGWRVLAVDPAHVCMIDLTLNKTAWHDYKCLGQESSIGIDIDIILGIIKAAKKGESVGFKIRDGKLTMTAGIIQREITPIDTTGMSDPKVPNLNLPGQYQINHEYLATAITQCASVSGHATIQANEGGIIISATNDTENARADIQKEYLAFYKVKEAMQSKFPLDYLQSLSRPAHLGMLLKGQDLEISMGNDYPIKIEAAPENESWGLTYLLAPEIESD